MSYYHQKLLIPVINHLSGCTEKIDEKARNIILQLLCAVFPVYFILCYSGILSFWTSSFRHIVGYAVLLLIVLISIKGEVTEVKWRDYIYYPFVLLGLGLIITGLIHPIGGDYFFSGVAFVFIFPALYLVWDNRRDYDVLIDALAKSIVIVGVLYAILCVCLAFTGAFHGINHRWSGTMVNVNLLSMTGINLFTAAVYMVLKEIQQSKRVFYTSAAACGVGFELLGA